MLALNRRFGELHENRHLAQAIERSIQERTWRRVDGLRVEIGGNRVTIHGATQSYYVKQLAIQAVFESIRSSDGRTVIVDIDVNPGKMRGAC
jgi:hypothetical protein